MALEFVALTTIAEVGVALAGFATLASAFNRHAFDSEAVFGVVANGSIAMVFSLFALRFGGADLGLRVLAVMLAAVAVMLLRRALRLWVGARVDETLVSDGPSTILGMAALVGMLSSFLFSVLVVVDVRPGDAGLMFESALLCHLLIAVFLLIMAVWRNFAVRDVSPAP